MQIKQLEYLIEVSKKKSFNAASENLWITPQSLSRSMTSMEEELGFKLFARTPQGVRLTHEGNLFLASAKEIVDIYQHALKEVNDYQSKAEQVSGGRLIVYAHSIFSMSVLSQAITQFCKEYPKIDVCLLEGISSSILRNLSLEQEQGRAHVYKMGILTVPQAAEKLQQFYKNQDGYRFIDLTHGEYVCCVSKKSELAAKRNLSLKTIAQYPLVRFTNDTGDVSEVQSFFLEAYGTPKVGFSTTSIGSWISAIENNVGVGLIHNIVLSHTSLIRAELDKVAVLPIRENTALEVGMLVPNMTEPFVDTFVNFIKDYFNNLFE